MRIEPLSRCAPRPATAWPGYVRAPKRVFFGSSFVEQTNESMLFLERHRDDNYKNLSDVGIWKLKRISEALGRVLAEAVSAPEPVDVRCDQCNSVVGKAE